MPTTPSVYRTCWPLVVGMFALGVDTWAVAGFLPSLADDVGVRVSVAGLSVSLFAVVYALAGPIAVGRTAHLPRKAVVTVALLALGAADLLLATADSFAAVLAFRTLAAAAAAVITPASGAYAAQVVPPRQRSAALALVFSGIAVAIALGVPLGAIASDRVSWRTVVLGVAAVAIVAAVLVAWRMPPAPGSARIRGADYRALAADPAVRLVCAVTFVAVAAPYVLYTYSTEVAEALGLTSSMVPVLLACFGVGAMIGNHLGGVFTDRRGPAWWVRVELVLLAVAMAALWVGPGRWLAPVVFLAWGIGAWGFGTPQQARLAHLQPERTALAFSLNASALYAGVAVGSASGGLFVEHGATLRGAWLAIGLAGLAFVLNEAVRRRGADPAT
jgi:predicted MFS family arabinose efflux permease